MTMAQKLALCLAVVAALIAGCSPSQDDSVNLNGKWFFRFDSLNLGTTSRWYEPDRANLGSTEISVPSFWESEIGQEADGIGWYSRTFVLDDTSRRSILFFEGVDDMAEVWLNGVFIGSHMGHDEPFTLNCAGRLKKGENVLSVKVQDFGGPGGIYKPVRLISEKAMRKYFASPFAEEQARPSEQWVKDAIVYSVFVRAFSPEGNFKALELKIPELRELGVTVLWLMPIHPIGLLNRKGSLGSPYAIADYLEINPEYGTMDDFRSLVRTVHENGMKIIIDLVANHTAWDSQLIFEHPEFFTLDSAGKIVAPNRDWTDVADLNYDNYELRKYMISMMRFWVENIGIDGFRCDVAELVPTTFWERARLSLDRIKPVFMLSEGSLPEHHLKAFDATYAWNTYRILGDIFKGKVSASEIHELLRKEALRYPKNSLRLRFHTNHDENYWDAPAVKKFGAEGVKVAAALMVALPGIPMLYNGEEAGSSNRLDLFEKSQIDWTRDATYREFYKKLIALRKTNVALGSGSYLPLQNSHNRQVLSFWRESEAQTVAVLLNFDRTPKSVTVILPPNGSFTTATDIFGTLQATVKDTTLMCSLPGFGIAVLDLKK